MRHAAKRLAGVPGKGKDRFLLAGGHGCPPKSRPSAERVILPLTMHVLKTKFLRTASWLQPSPSWPKHLPKALPSNIITRGIGISIYGFEGDANIRPQCLYSSLLLIFPSVHSPCIPLYPDNLDPSRKLLANTHALLIRWVQNRRSHFWSKQD